MEVPVNFDNLRSITGGDVDVESVLFASFLASARLCVEGLRASGVSGDEEMWRQKAHAFKGICLNLGADTLGGLCEQAQTDWRATGEERRALLALIEAEFTRVSAAIDQALKGGAGL